MKIWLDDERPAPFGYTRVRTAGGCIALLRGYGSAVTEIELDHDLGDPEAGTGMDVVRFVEELWHNNPDYVPPLMKVHSANPVGREAMQKTIMRLALKIMANMTNE